MPIVQFYRIHHPYRDQLEFNQRANLVIISYPSSLSLIYILFIYTYFYSVESDAEKCDEPQIESPSSPRDENCDVSVSPNEGIGNFDCAIVHYCCWLVACSRLNL